jgi:uncharacterized protein YggE
MPSNGEAATGITVHGTGEVRATPDVAIVSLGVEVHADLVAEAREQAAVAQGAVLDALREQGVASGDFQTSGLSLQPRYDHRGDGRPRITGYAMSNRVHATVRDTEAVGRVVDAAIEAGGNAVRVDGIAFDFSDPSGLVEQARRAAVADARTAAGQLAEAAGTTVGTVLSITEVEGGGPGPFPKREMLRMAAADTPVEPGASAITVRVVVRYAIG